MSGTGWVGISHAPAGDIRLTHQYDVTVDFQIAFDWGGYNYEGAYYEVWCDGQYVTGDATFSVPSGGGSWVWERIDTRTFRVTMPASGQSKYVEARGYISTGVNPSTIDTGNVGYTLPAVEWEWPVRYNANGGSGAPGSQTKVYGSALPLSAQAPTRAGHVFLGWSTRSNATSPDYLAGGSYVADAPATLYAVWRLEVPSDPSACSNARASDTRNDVGWARGDLADVTWSSVKVERSVDGGAWSEVASLSGAAASYADSSTSANHSYAYRVRACNASGCSGYAASATTYNTPAAPTALAPSRTGEASVSIAVENPANTATALELQRSPDGSSWASAGTFQGKVTSVEDSPGGGTWVYRARNTRGDLASAWSPASAPVVTICAPAAPTPASPARGQVVEKSAGSVVFAWRHNPLDGSAQTAAQLRYSTDGGASWATVDVEGDAQSEAVANSFAINAEVTWCVRTKGAHDDYGPWSGNSVFSVRQAPTVAFARPSGGEAIENTPVLVELQYADASGSFAGGSLVIERAGVVERTFDLATLALSIPASTWLPEDGAAYTFRASVRSTSTLAASAVRKVVVDFVLPQAADLVIEPDPETGRVALVCNLARDDERVPAVSIDLWRVSGSGRMLLGSGLAEGAGVVDAYAPLNVAYSYEAVTFADSGAACATAFAARVDTPWSFIYFGGDLARGKWNPSHSWSLAPSVEYVRYAGLSRPVAYMEDYNDESHSVSFALETDEEAAAFRRMMAACEPVIAKLSLGEVIRAVPKVSATRDMGTRALYGEVSVDLTVVDGDAL